MQAYRVRFFVSQSFSKSQLWLTLHVSDGKKPDLTDTSNNHKVAFTNLARTLEKSLQLCQLWSLRLVHRTKLL